MNDHALEMGFDVAGIITNPKLPKQNIKRFHEFIAEKEHGTMEWLADTIAVRTDPKALMKTMNTLIILGVNYMPEHQPLEWLKQKNQGAIASYALGRDYHDFLKKKLRAITQKLAHHYGGDYRIYVDTAPLAEKPLAQLAGLGWQGKHSNLVSQKHGSWLLLATIATSHILEDEPLTASEDYCGSCTACIDICPTNAITQPYHLDARKCIAYLTIEHQGSIPLEFRSQIGNRIFGCDDCLAVCPWNKFATISQELDFKTRESLQNRSLAEFLKWDEALFRKNFSKSPIKRLGYERFIRNILIAIGNSENKNHLPAIETWRHNPNPMLAETADWAWHALNQPSN